MNDTRRFGTTMILTDHLDRDMHLRVEKSGAILVMIDDHENLNWFEMTPAEQKALRDYLDEMLQAYEAWQGKAVG